MQATSSLGSKKLSELTDAEREKASRFLLRFREPTIPLLEGEFRFTGKLVAQPAGKSLMEICREDKSILERISRGGKTVMNVSPEIVLVDFAAERLTIQ